MSGSNGRQLLNSLSLSSAAGLGDIGAETACQLGKNPTRSTAGKHYRRSPHSKAVAGNRRLIVESLERREMMAADTASVYYNPLIATDVSGDFAVTPLDVLLVINALNQQGAGAQPSLGTIQSTPAPSMDLGPMVDVSKDGYVTALDALLVINQLSLGEGEDPILLALRPQIFSAAGVLVSPDASGNYTLSAGEDFKLRIQAQDQRGVDATGVFSVYLDLNYTTVGSPNTELAEFKWSEYQELIFSSNLNGGSFKLDFNGQQTNTIQVATSGGFLDEATTAANIRSAIGALPDIGGVANVNVTRVSRSGSRVFAISYVNANVRRDIANPTIVESNLIATSGTVTTSVVATANPTVNAVVAPGITYPANPLNVGNPVTYSSFSFNAGLQSVPGVGYKLNDIGGVGSIDLNNLQPDFAPNPQTFLNIFDAAFRSAGAGTVVIDVDSAGDPQRELLLYGSQTRLPDSSVLFPAPFQIRFVENIQADTITRTVDEDSGDNSIPVTATLITGTSFTVESVTQPAIGTGTASFLPNSRTVVYKPADNFFGPTTFTYTVVSNLGDRSTATVSLTVTGVNDAPVLVTGNSFTVAEDTPAASPLVITTSQLFTPGPSETTQTVTLGTPALAAGQTGATVSRDVNGNVTVVPQPNYFGPVVFTVVGTDNGTNPANLSTTATVTVTVTPVNDSPEANILAYSVNEDPVSPLSIVASDLFRPGPATVGAETGQTVTLTNVTAVAGQTGGSISLGSGGGTAVFNPTANFFGPFLFTAIAQDNGTPVGTSVASTFTINVQPQNDAPTAVDDTGSAGFTVANVPGVVYELDVLANDSAGPGETTDTIRIVGPLGTLTGTGSATSSISIKADGQRVLYTPGTGIFNVTQTFTYTIQDSQGATSTATATVFVAPPILPFAVNDTGSVSEGGGAITINVLANDLFNSGETRLLQGFTQPTNGAGTVALLDNGTPGVLSDDQLTFTPATNFSGTATFTYRMIDTRSGSVESVGTVNVTVAEVNDAPTLVNQVASNGEEDTPLTISSTLLLTGSSAGPNESNQTLAITNAVVTTAGAGTASVVGGNVVYTPAKDFNGQALVTFTATDSGTPPQSATAVLTITVAAKNDAPLANGPTNVPTTSEGVPLTIVGSTIVINDRPGPATALDELQNQSVSLTGVFLDDTSAGTVALVGTNIVYTPTALFNGNVNFRYRIADTGTPVETAEGTFSVRVTEVNNAPVPVNASRDAFASLPITINLASELASASRGAPNESSQTLTVSLPSGQSTVGSVVLNADGTFTYTAPAGFSGADTFTYRVTDNGTTNGIASPLSGTATVTVNVAPFQPSSVVGSVWIDKDNDGSMDDDEKNLGGVRVVLTGRALGASSDIAPIIRHTLSNGDYSFTQLPPGTYTVSYVLPALIADGIGANSVTTTIVSPGGTNSEINFAVAGIDYSAFSSVRRGSALAIENLASAYYGTYPDIRQKGVVGAVAADGTSVWTSFRDGEDGDYSGFMFAEIVLSNDRLTGYLTLVDGAGQRMTATVPRTKLAMSEDSQGNMLVYVLARMNELKFEAVTSSGVPRITARGYLQSVDRALAEFSF